MRRSPFSSEHSRYSVIYPAILNVVASLLLINQFLLESTWTEICLLTIFAATAIGIHLKTFGFQKRNERYTREYVQYTHVKEMLLVCTVGFLFIHLFLLFSSLSMTSKRESSYWIFRFVVPYKNFLNILSSDNTTFLALNKTEEIIFWGNLLGLVNLVSISIYFCSYSLAAGSGALSKLLKRTTFQRRISVVMYTLFVLAYGTVFELERITLLRVVSTVWMFILFITIRTLFRREPKQDLGTAVRRSEASEARSRNVFLISIMFPYVLSLYMNWGILNHETVFRAPGIKVQIVALVGIYAVLTLANASVAWFLSKKYLVKGGETNVFSEYLRKLNLSSENVSIILIAGMILYFIYHAGLSQ